MSYPENPDTIILKNKFYPKGLREIDIWNHYQSVKRDLLKQVSFRDLTFYLIVDGKIVVRRRGKSAEYIRLNSSNYDQIITGRTISIHSTMNREEDIGIIDIDCDDWKSSKAATIETFEYMMDNAPYISNASIRYTGKTGFHILCNLNRKINVDATRMLLRKTLVQSPLSKRYTIEQKRTSGIPNLDLAPNKYRGGFITLYSLSTVGLVCTEVKPTDVLSYQPHYAKTKIL